MNVHEYQAKELMRKFGIAVLDGKMANTPEEAVAAGRATAVLLSGLTGKQKMKD